MNVLITGFSSGIGKAIASNLTNNGYTIFTLKTRLEDTKNLEIEVSTLLEEIDIDVLINVAGFGIFEPHEEIDYKKLELLIDVNLKAPILLTNLCLRSLKKTKGHIINVTSVEATKHSKFSAAYTATKSGLRDFSLSLFEEVRKAGVGVTSVNPDMTDTNFFDDLRFGPSKKEKNHLVADEIARTIHTILQMDGVVTDITLRSQFFGIEKKELI